jgi:hypothetical protein
MKIISVTKKSTKEKSKRPVFHLLKKPTKKHWCPYRPCEERNTLSAMEGHFHLCQKRIQKKY